MTNTRTILLVTAALTVAVPAAADAKQATF
jgi:hypothetical protein